MNKPLCNDEINAGKGGRCEPHHRKAISMLLVSATVDSDEVIECCLGFLVGKLLVNLLRWLDLGKQSLAVRAFTQSQFCLVGGIKIEFFYMKSMYILYWG